MARAKTRKEPSLIKAYYILTKPGIIYGNVMTGIAGFLFASRWHIDMRLLLALLLGMSGVIACGCVLNNYLDRSIDRNMARTKQRALVTGKIPVTYAIIFAACLGLLGFFILSYTNWLVMLTGTIALVSYVVVYGFAKRMTAYSTLIGTVPGAASLVAGYVAVTNRFDLGAALLGVIMIIWQMPHFYAIAIRRLDDYRTAGLPVWPAEYGIENTKKHIVAYVLLFILANVAITFYGYTGYMYAAIMVGLGCYWLWKGLHGFKHVDSTKWAGQMFGFSLVVLLVFSSVLSLGRLLP